MGLSSNSPSARPWGLHWRSHTLFIVSTVGIGLFTDLFLYGLVVPILPFILRDRINVPQSEIQAYTSSLLAAYAAASVICSLPAGIVADKTSSRQLPFLLGLIALLGATLMLLLGQTVPVLVLARVLQGISAAVVWTIGLALVLDTVGPENLGKTIGSIFGFISIGELAAPVLGGVVYKEAGYGGVFGLGFAILALDFIMRLLLIEKKVAKGYDEKTSDESTADRDADGGEEHANEDFHQQADDSTIQADESASLLNKPPSSSSPSPWKIPPNQPQPVRIFPLFYPLSSPRLLTALLLALVQATLLSTFDATIPTEAQSLFSFTSLSSGLLFIALVLPYLLLGPLAGWAVDKYGTKPAAVIGFTYLIPILVCLRFVDVGGQSEIIKFCALLSLCGIGLAIIGSPSIVEASYVVDKYNEANPGFFGAQGPYAQLYGINSMVFSAGLTLGPLIAGGLREKVGYGDMNAVVAGICALTAGLSLVFVGGMPQWLRRRVGSKEEEEEG